VAGFIRIEFPARTNKELNTSYFTGFENTRPVGSTRQAAGLLKTEKKIVKLKMQFGEETRFDTLIRRIVQTRVQLLPTMRLSLRALAMAERSRPIRRRVD
jgi:hypothetical protein